MMTSSTTKTAYRGAALVFLTPAIALACKYTVRDVGFVDLGSPPYRIWVFVDKDTPETVAGTFKEISYAALLDSNVELEVVNIDRRKEHESVRHVEDLGIRQFPAAVMVSPKGGVLKLDLPASVQSDKQAVWSWIEGLVASRATREIQDRIVQAYAAVLLIDGEKEADNERASKAAGEAIRRIGGAMGQMPKPTKEAPVLVRLTRKRAEREKILLWSLGLDAKDLGDPRAAVIYGRGRWIGPMFRAETITPEGLTDVLSLIGSDCECGLDRRQMMGVMLPMQWDDELLSRCARGLGFDPENPMIKTEISRILSIKPGSGTGDGLLGYSEQVVEFSTTPAEAATPRTRITPAEPDDQGEPTTSPTTNPTIMRTPATAVPPAPSPRPSPRDTGPPSGPGLGLPKTVVGGMILVVIIGGVLVVLRAQRRAA